MTPSVRITGLAHVGIRVRELERSLRFYALLGFTKVAGPMGQEPVVILEHPGGVELNLIINGTDATDSNVLMDVPDKHAGFTHIALACADISAARSALEEAGVPLSGGPVQFPNGHRAIFVRDPDRNVFELNEAPQG
jgi:lactoylglutathione lyase